MFVDDPAGKATVLDMKAKPALFRFFFAFRAETQISDPTKRSHTAKKNGTLNSGAPGRA